MHPLLNSAAANGLGPERDALMAVLDRDGLLSSIPPKSRAPLLAAGWVRKVAAGESVQHQGDEAKGLFCVVSGQIRVTILDAAGAEI